MIVGATLAQVSHANPVLAFAIGFLSHYILDSIPHWDYPLRSSSKSRTINPLDGEIIIGKGFLIDLIKIGFDFLIGLSFVMLFFVPGGFFLFLHPLELIKSPILWAAFGSILPDIFQFVYYKMKSEPFTTLQKIHGFFHTNTRFKNRNIVGPLLQIIFITAVILSAQFFY